MRAVELRGKSVVLIDQTKLPKELRFVRCASAEAVARAIERMQVRGAPALGMAATMALALVTLRSKARGKAELLRELERAAALLKQTRPTGADLFACLDRVLAVARSAEGGAGEAREAVVEETRHVLERADERDRRMGELGATLIENGNTVLTHCNAGWLATAGKYGTALAPIRVAREQGKRVNVIVTETRPLLQGARLTAWELKREGIPVTVITDGAVGHLMAKRGVDLVMVGADRIASNGDVVNKIGTYTLAVLAKEHGAPFYSVAPTTTIDLGVRSGFEVPIEERDPREVELLGETRLIPKGVRVLNPAFDVTPARLVTAIVTELGIVKPAELKSLFEPPKFEAAK